MPSIEKLDKAMRRARKAWKADKEDEALRKAFRKAKRALKKARGEADGDSDAKTRAPAESNPGTKDTAETSVLGKRSRDNEASGDVQLVKEKLKIARRAWRKDPENESLKREYKQARLALKEAEQRTAKRARSSTADAPENPVLAGLLRKAAEQQASGASTRPSSGTGKGAGAASGAGAGASTGASGSAGGSGIKRCFVGNLSYEIDEEKLRDAFESKGARPVTNIFFVTDRISGEFYGSSFVEFGTATAANAAVALAGSKILGRPVKVALAAPKERKATHQPKPPRPPGERPKDGTYTVFFGNLSYDIDEEKLKEFCEGIGKVRAIRFCTRKGTDEFNGCAFLDFLTTEAVDKVIETKNGAMLLGRAVRLDYA